MFLHVNKVYRGHVHSPAWQLNVVDLTIITHSRCWKRRSDQIRWIFSEGGFRHLDERKKRRDSRVACKQQNFILLPSSGRSSRKGESFSMRYIAVLIFVLAAFAVNFAFSNPTGGEASYQMQPPAVCYDWGCELATPTPRLVRTQTATATATPTSTRTVSPTVTTTVRVVMRIATATSAPVSPPVSSLGGGPPPATAPPSPWTPVVTPTRVRGCAPVTFSESRSAGVTTVTLAGAWWLSVTASPFYDSVDFDTDKLEIYLRFSVPTATISVHEGPYPDAMLCASYTFGAPATATPTQTTTVTRTATANTPVLEFAACSLFEDYLYVGGRNLASGSGILYLGPNANSPTVLFSLRENWVTWTNEYILYPYLGCNSIRSYNYVWIDFGHNLSNSALIQRVAGVTIPGTPTRTATPTVTVTPTIARSPTPLPQDLTSTIVDSWRTTRRALAEIYYPNPTSQRKMGFHSTNGLCDDFEVPSGIRYQIFRGSETSALGGPGPTTNVCAAVFWRDGALNPIEHMLDLCINGCDPARFYPHPTNGSKVVYRTPTCAGVFVLPTDSSVNVNILDAHVTNGIATRVCYAEFTLRG